MDIQTLIDKQEIADVLYRYARGIDRRDFALLRSCFHPDAFDDHGSQAGGVDDLIASAEQFGALYAMTYHFIGNLLIEVDGDVARAETYTMATHRVEPTEEKDGKDDVWGIRYVDRFEKRAGEWKIAYRVIAHEWRRVYPVAPGRQRGTVPGHWGRHDEKDPIRWILDAKAPAEERS